MKKKKFSTIAFFRIAYLHVLLFGIYLPCQWWCFIACYHVLGLWDGWGTSSCTSMKHYKQLMDEGTNTLLDMTYVRILYCNMHLMPSFECILTWFVDFFDAFSFVCCLCYCFSSLTTLWIEFGHPRIWCHWNLLVFDLVFFCFLESAGSPELTCRCLVVHGCSH